MATGNETSNILLSFNNGPEAREIFFDTVELELTGEHYVGLITHNGRLYYEYEVPVEDAIMLVLAHGSKIIPR